MAEITKINIKGVEYDLPSGAGLTIINLSETDTDEFKSIIIDGSYTNYVIRDDLNGSKDTLYYPYGDIYNNGSIYFLSVNAETTPVMIKSIAWNKETGIDDGGAIVAEFGGTEVVANNGETTTDTLSTLKVGDINYAIPSGGGTSENNFVFDIEDITDETTKSEVFNMLGFIAGALQGIATNGDLTITTEKGVKYVSINDIYTENFADLANGVYDNFIIKIHIAEGMELKLKKSATLVDTTGLYGGNSTYYNISSLRFYNGESLFMLSLTVSCSSNYISMNMTILDLLNA